MKYVRETVTGGIGKIINLNSIYDKLASLLTEKSIGEVNEEIVCNTPQRSELYLTTDKGRYHLGTQDKEKRFT